MIRKVIKQGHNTLTVTLPSKWVKSRDIKPGDDINIKEKDNGLLITSEKCLESNKSDIKSILSVLKVFPKKDLRGLRRRSI